ncbi:phosphatidate cytidylyltransferase [Xylanimonas cellulosilytica DSM 15894]|uniref:Phosphatidate cytidylyltransferase n=1 Tax=Xylanimonas cellulosilytica (strain DSM 15894 / JCM 12276 / CECT 5975 / KCTC 9989 / LMG 20990 / NBRC 107835 / XIL07) TaxID=446471 RepID=D1C026_XYLCX|nr:phosphatidate cytidylyltransferase [Xylanimonas cellulosilytica]ACZ30215.1 phosphatidate cytidylyltransferase [Xylanimonas cellulosilytica DSM 15894]
MTAIPEPSPPAARTSRAGRNLPAAIAVGVLLLGLVGASLWFRPEPFVALVAVVVGAGLWELRTAFARRDIVLPIWPLLVGGVGMVVSARMGGPEGLLVAYVLTVGAATMWRVLDGPGRAAVRDVAAAAFAATYVPFLAGFVVLLLGLPGPQDDRWLVAVFILLAVANDTGGYIAGVLFGRHPLAPTVSPKKSWEGMAGSVLLTTAVGVVGAHWVLDKPFLPEAGLPWLGSSLVLGLVLGVMTAITATVGDLAESLLKRDLDLKDMGSLLPGHGGVLDRVDSMLVTAPFVYLVLTVAVPGPAA